MGAYTSCVGVGCDFQIWDLGLRVAGGLWVIAHDVRAFI
jgi:hypothetical protein